MRNSGAVLFVVPLVALIALGASVFWERPSSIDYTFTSSIP